MAFFHPNFMLQTSHEDDQNQPPILPSCNPQEFHGVGSFLGKRSSMSFSTGIDLCGEDHHHMNNNNNNHGARWKTKQLEKDYDILRKQFEAVKAENDALLAQNQKLHAEILALKTREPTESINLNKETEGSCSNRSENSSEIKLDISINPAIDSPLSTIPISRPFFHLHFPGPLLDSHSFSTILPGPKFSSAARNWIKLLRKKACATCFVAWMIRLGFGHG
ncbi:hypothetical protein DH2020_003376 [Rehmannia glutinosa]|uniref:Homeobox-leucine zipper protein n=1 Tax=Rehmannia glutinosa TaxID=99300 RepID=A0ABR0XLL7_REHGL